MREKEKETYGVVLITSPKHTSKETTVTVLLDCPTCSVTLVVSVAAVSESILGNQIRHNSFFKKINFSTYHLPETMLHPYPRKKKRKNEDGIMKEEKQNY